MKLSYKTDKEITNVDDQLNELQKAFEYQNGVALSINLPAGGSLVLSFDELHRIIDLARKGLILEKLE